MAQSNLVNANKKIEGKVLESYQAIENAVVGGYSKIEDKFVSRYLTEDGETIEEAKARLRKEQADRKEAQALHKERHKEEVGKRHAVQTRKEDRTKEKR